MPVIPEFNPGTIAPGGTIFESTQTAMQRATQSRLQSEQLAQEIEARRQEWEIKRPVLEAQQQAALVTGAADLVLQKQAADFIRDQTNSLPAIQSEWHRLATIADPKERTNAQNEFLNRIAPISMLPAGEALYKSFTHNYDKTQQMQYQNDIVAQKDAATQARIETAKLQEEGRNQREADKRVIDQQKLENDAIKNENARLKAERDDLTKRLGITNKADPVAVSVAKDQDRRRNKALDEIATNRENLGQMSYAIDQMAQDIKAEQSSLLGSGPIVGSDLVAPLRPSARQVQQDIGDFANRIMSTVKNIRNLQEFRAVTAQIPRASDPAEVQNRKLQKLQEVNQVLVQRNDLREKLMRDNPDMDSTEAEHQAAIQFPFSGLNQNPQAGGGLSDAERARLQELRAKLGK